MTPCTAMRLRLAAYADDELGVEGAVGVEEHLTRCAPCRGELERHRAQSRAIRDLSCEAPPPGLEGRIRVALFGSARPRSSAILAAVVLAAVVFGYFLAARRGAADAIASDAARIHRRADAGDLRLAIHSASAVEVNDWLRGKLSFPATISGSRPAEIRLEGAATVRLHGERVGLVRYRMDGSAVSLFLLPRREWHGGRLARFRGIDFRVFDARGLSLVAWSHPPLSYVLVADGGAVAKACAVCHGERDTPPFVEFAAVAGGGT